MTFEVWRAEQDVRLGEEVASTDKPAVTYLPNGGYVVGWREGQQLKFKVYNGLGNSDGTVYSVHTGATPENTLDIHAVGPDGNFAVSWNTNNELSARVFTLQNDGKYVGGAVTNISPISGAIEIASLTTGMNGGFASVHMSGSNVCLQLHDANGAKILDEPFKVFDSTTTGTTSTDYPSVTKIASNKFVVSYGDGDNIFARIVTINGGAASYANVAPIDPVNPNRGLGTGDKSQVVALKGANGEPDGRFAIVQSRGGRPLLPSSTMRTAIVSARLKRSFSRLRDITTAISSRSRLFAVDASQ